MLGIIFSLSTALGFGTSPIFARVGLQHIRITTLTLISLAVGTIIILVLAFAFYTKEIFGLTGVAFLWLLLTGAINFPVGRLCEYTGIHFAGVARAAPVIGAAPLVSIFLAVTVGDESLTIPIVLGTLLVVGGVALIVTEQNDSRNH